MRCFPLILVLINLALAIAAHILILFETVLDGCIYLLLHRTEGKHLDLFFRLFVV